MNCSAIFVNTYKENQNLGGFYMTKRGYIRVLSFGILLLTVIIAAAVINLTNANAYKAELEATYQQSLSELGENLNSIETNFSKGLYANSAETLTEISSDIFTETQSAKQALSRLPVSQMNLTTTYKFLTQAGDYAAYISNKAVANNEISQKDRESIEMLLKYSRSFANNVNSMVSLCNSGLKITDNSVSANSEINVSGLKNTFSQAEETFADYPTLLYDGPYADAVLQKKAEMTKNKKTYSDEEAKKIAAKYLNADENKISYEGEESGNLESYIFRYGKYSIAITKYGGYLNYILYSGKIEETKIDKDTAILNAKQYLEKTGYKSMKESYYSVNDNICLINFNYVTPNNTHCYADLVKVGVAMDSGKIVSVEAGGYLTNHKKRAEIKKAIPKDKAQKGINPNLEVLGVKTCIIPKENGLEKNCYEFHCRSKKNFDEVLIYVNAETGVEEDIKLLLYSDNGTLVK